VDINSFGTITGTWYVVVAGGGGTSDHALLSNLAWADAGHTINDDIVPTSSGNYDLGSVPLPFASGYIKDVYVNDVLVYDKEYQNGNSGGAKTITWANGNKQAITLTGTPSVLTFLPPDGVCNLLLKVTQGSGGSKTATWPGIVKWPSATAPTLSTTAGYIDIMSFYFDGTYYYGMYNTDFR
jgi:hypothetical protein